MNSEIRTPVYLDYNATTPLRPEAWSAMGGLADCVGNPASVHRAGQAMRAELDGARARVASRLGVQPHQLIWTSGGTEANNLAILGRSHAVSRILVSALEHDAVRKAVEASGVRQQSVPATTSGVVDLNALEALLKASDEPTLVCVMAVNNETGVVQPLQEVVALARAYKAGVHVDAVQALGKISFDFAALDIDSAALSAHKCGGPAGIGALLLRDHALLRPHVHGGRQEFGLRAGMPSVMLAVGFAAALEATLAQDPCPRQWQHDLEAQLRALAPDVRIFGAEADRVTTTSCFAVPGFAQEAQLMALNWDGVHISSGAACSSGTVRPSSVLLAMGVPPALAQCAVRVSWGFATSVSDIQTFVSAWAKAYGRHQGLRVEGDERQHQSRQHQSANLMKEMSA